MEQQILHQSNGAKQPSRSSHRVVWEVGLVSLQMSDLPMLISGSTEELPLRGSCMNSDVLPIRLNALHCQGNGLHIEQRPTHDYSSLSLRSYLILSPRSIR